MIAHCETTRTHEPSVIEKNTQSHCEGMPLTWATLNADWYKVTSPQILLFDFGAGCNEDLVQTASLGPRSTHLASKIVGASSKISHRLFVISCQIRVDKSWMSHVHVDLIIGQTTGQSLAKEQVGKLAAPISCWWIGWVLIIQSVKVNAALDRHLMANGGEHNNTGWLRFLDPVQQSHCEHKVPSNEMGDWGKWSARVFHNRVNLDAHSCTGKECIVMLAFGILASGGRDFCRLCLPHMVDRKLLLDTVCTQSVGAGHDTAIVDKDMKRKASLQELFGSMMAVLHIVQIQGQEIKVGLALELWVLFLDLGLGLFNGFQGLAHGAAGEEDVCTMCGQGDGCGVAQARVGASDDGDLASEVRDIIVGISGSLSE